MPSNTNAQNYDGGPIRRERNCVGGQEDSTVEEQGKEQQKDRLNDGNLDESRMLVLCLKGGAYLADMPPRGRPQYPSTPTNYHHESYASGVLVLSLCSSYPIPNIIVLRAYMPHVSKMKLETDVEVFPDQLNQITHELGFACGFIWVLLLMIFLHKKSPSLRQQVTEEMVAELHFCSTSTALEVKALEC